MKSIHLKTLVIAAATVVFSANALADGGSDNSFYIGIGAAKSKSATENGSVPISFGYLNTSSARDVVWGLDISAEGTMLDSTWGQNNSLSQGTSYNFLLGRNISKDDNSRFDIALLIGLRERSAECPASYLGYQCYADTAPETSYGFNYGVVLTWTYNRMLVGVRTTGESVQAMVGYRF